MVKVGITATVPVEIIFAAGFRPVDLNNLFITSEKPEELVRQAESTGFSHSVCSWIKGIYSTVLNRGISKVIAVTGGDCSNTIALSELLAGKGVEVVLFEYPTERRRENLLAEMEKLRLSLGAEWVEIEKVKARLDRIRAKLQRLDALTFRDNKVTGRENHLFMVSSSDFRGDPDRYEKDLDQFLAKAQKRNPENSGVRLGYLGVPPIYSNFYEVVESLGAGIVFNEVQRQFSMPAYENELVDQYLEYTYPYDFKGRLVDIERAIDERRLDGLIHYAQTFCYRQIYDIMLREDVTVPILTVEGDRPGETDSRTLLRIETFVEMLTSRLKLRS